MCSHSARAPDTGLLSQAQYPTPARLAQCLVLTR